MFELTPEAHAENVLHQEYWYHGPESDAPFKPATTNDEFNIQQLAYHNRLRKRYQAPVLTISDDLKQQALDASDTAKSNGFAAEPTLLENTYLK